MLRSDESKTQPFGRCKNTAVLCCGEAGQSWMQMNGGKCKEILEEDFRLGVCSSRKVQSKSRHKAHWESVAERHNLLDLKRLIVMNRLLK